MWLHLLLNMYALYPLAGIIEARRGALWMLFFVLTTGIISNVAQFYFPSLFELSPKYRDLMGGGLFGGMSGVIFAMFGYLMAKTLVAPEPGLQIPKDTIVMVIVWFFLCMSGWIGPVGNTAHGFGLLSGCIIGVAPKLWRRIVPSK
jgi:GlpG protein